MEGLFECVDQYESRINGARTSPAMAECAIRASTRARMHPTRWLIANPQFLSGRLAIGEAGGFDGTSRWENLAPEAGQTTIREPNYRLDDATYGGPGKFLPLQYLEAPRSNASANRGRESRAKRSRRRELHQLQHFVNARRECSVFVARVGAHSSAARALAEFRPAG